MSGKHHSINISLTKLHIGGARGADPSFNSLTGISSNPVDFLQSIFINTLYVSFTVTLVNVKELPMGKAFLLILYLGGHRIWLS